MLNQLITQGRKKLSDLISKNRAASKVEIAPEDNIVNTLRSDLLNTSQTLPGQKNFLQKQNIKIWLGVFVSLWILGLIWYLLAGPGRPGFEGKLASLVGRESTNTATAQPTSIPTTDPPPTSSPTITPSATPSSTPTLVPSPTRKSPTKTPTNTQTSAPVLISTATPEGCREAVSITLADVGKTLCVKGKVVETITKPNGFMVIFSSEKGAFYWVSYDMVWSQAQVKACYQITGVIQQMGSNPILIFDYSNMPQECP